MDIASNNKKKTWHAKHRESLNAAARIADAFAKGIGSWPFIIIQTFFVIAWIALNLLAYMNQWDPYPFILLNLLFSTQAAYTAPIIMMSQNRQNERDRHQSLEDYETNIEAKREVEQIQKELSRIEQTKLDKIIRMLEEAKK